MSSLDKEKVLAEFTEAYQKAHGKKPKIESSNGWYSVDGGKNVRLAQLADDAKALAKGKISAKSSDADKKPAKKATATKKSDAKTSSKAAPKKATAKKPAAKKAVAKPAAKKPAAKTKQSGSGNGLTAKELWRQQLENSPSKSRLPRGV